MNKSLYFCASALPRFCTVSNLEGLPAYLEGTWRAVVGHLEGKADSLQTLIQRGFTDKTALTWRVFGKSIYKRCGKNVNRMHTKEADHER